MSEPVGFSGDEGQQERRLTVAQVRERADHAEATFYESARFYRLVRANPTYASALQRLRAAAASGKPLRVRFLAPNSDIIETVRSDE
jgi:hypothetical protein